MFVVLECCGVFMLDVFMVKEYDKGFEGMFWVIVMMFVFGVILKIVEELFIMV